MHLPDTRTRFFHIEDLAEATFYQGLQDFALAAALSQIPSFITHGGRARDSLTPLLSKHDRRAQKQYTHHALSRNTWSRLEFDPEKRPPKTMSVSPACPQPMALPEIVAAILDQMHGTKVLFAALQVNRLWAAEATRLLWRVDPPIRALADNKDAERLQCYADKITSLYLMGDKDAWKSRFILQGLRFPHLSQVIMKAPRSKDEQMFLQYLQPELRKFECGRGPVSKFYLMQI